MGADGLAGELSSSVQSRRNPQAAPPCCLTHACMLIICYIQLRVVRACLRERRTYQRVRLEDSLCVRSRVVEPKQRERRGHL